MSRLPRLPDKATGTVLLILLASCHSTGPEALPAGPDDFATPKQRAETPLPGDSGGAAAEAVGAEVLALEGRGDRPLAWLGEKPIPQHRLFDYLVRQDPMQAMQAVNGMLAEILAARIAKEDSITVPGSEVEHFYAKEIERDRGEARRRMGPNADFEEYLALRYGKSPVEYRSWMRQTVSRRLVKWYAMVYRAMQEESCHCRLIAVADKSQAERLRRDITAGADFQVLAMKHSLHPTGAQGGRLTPLSRESGHPLAKRIFAMREGEVSEPIPAPLGDRRVWSLILMEKRVQPRRERFAKVAAEVARRVRVRPPRLDEALSFFFSARARLGLRLVDPETTNGAHDRAGKKRTP